VPIAIAIILYFWPGLKKYAKNIVLAVLGILFLFILWYSISVLIYVVVSLVLTLILSPLNQRIKKMPLIKGNVPSAISALLTLVIFVTVVVLIGRVFIPLISQEIQILSSITMNDVYNVLSGPLKAIEEWGAELEMGVSEEINERKMIRDFLFSHARIDHVPDFFSQIAGGVGSSIMAAFSILFISFFLLKDSWIVDKAIDVMSPDHYRERVFRVVNQSRETLSRYFLGLLVQVSIITILVSFGLSLVGIENALIIGLFAGLMNVIPYLGPIIGIVFGLLIAITTNINLNLQTELIPLILQVLTVFGFVQLFDNFITQPVVFSKSINAHPLEVFLVILVAGNLAGIAGMVLAVPGYSVIRVIAAEFFGEFRLVQTMTRTQR
jgi:predicted PurR-regulated permease PerM